MCQEVEFRSFCVQTFLIQLVPGLSPAHKKRMLWWRELPCCHGLRGGVIYLFNDYFEEIGVYSCTNTDHVSVAKGYEEQRLTLQSISQPTRFP